MSNPFDDLGGRPLPDEDPYWRRKNAAFHRETYQEALARSICGKTESTMTEQELAAKVVADRERMRRHDLAFSAEFISGGESLLVSRELARLMGSLFNDNRDALGDDE